MKFCYNASHHRRVSLSFRAMSESSNHLFPSCCVIRPCTLSHVPVRGFKYCTDIARCLEPLEGKRRWYACIVRIEPLEGHKRPNSSDGECGTTSFATGNECTLSNVCRGADQGTGCFWSAPPISEIGSCTRSSRRPKCLSRT